MRDELWIVRAGVATPGTADEADKCDWIDSFAVIAETPEKALRLAMLYDTGDAAPDNYDWHGGTIKAVW